MKLLLVIVVGLMAAGCQTREELRVQQASEHEMTCRGIGAQPGTDAYTACRLQLMQMAANDEAAAQARRRRAGAAFAAGLSRASEGYAQAAATNRPVSCSSYRLGNTVQTTCN